MAKKKISLTIDDAHPSRRRDDDHGGGGATGHPHPAALLPPRPEPGRLLPGVRRGRQGHGLLPGGVQLAGLGRDGGADQLAGNPPGPPRHRRTAAGQPQHGLPDLRAGRPLRAAKPGLRDGRPGAALRGPAETVPHRAVEPFRGPRQREVRPLRPLRPRLRGNPGRLQPQPARPRVRDGRRPGPRRQHGRLGVHPVRAVHQRLPDGGVPGKARGRPGLGRPGQSRDARGGADGPVDPRGHRRRVWAAARHARHGADDYRAPAAGLRPRVRHRLGRRHDDHRGGPRVPDAAEGATTTEEGEGEGGRGRGGASGYRLRILSPPLPSSPFPLAHDHLLLAGLDQLSGKVLSRADPARLDLPLADDDALGADARPITPRRRASTRRRFSWWR